MKKKLVAITSVVLVSVGATMTVASQSQDQNSIHIKEIEGLVTLPTTELKELTQGDAVVDNNRVSDNSQVSDNNQESGYNQVISTEEENGVDVYVESENKTNVQVEEKSPAPQQNTTSQNQSSNQVPTIPVVNKEQDGSYLSTVEQLIFQKVNEERQKAGMGALSYSETMQKYARSKSADMGERGYFSHENPEGQLITASMQQDGVSYSAWGENIAYIGGVSDAEALANQFMTNWMNSEGHRANILSSNFSSIGIGVYEANGKVYATQEFYR